MDTMNKALDGIVQSSYCNSWNAVARMVYEKDMYVREANATTSVYYDGLENMEYHGALLGQLHFGMCVMGDILFPTIHNNHWLHLGTTLRDSSGQILFDVQVNMLKGLFLRDQNQSLLSRSWIFEGDGCKQYLMLYADPQVVEVFMPAYQFDDGGDAMPTHVCLDSTEEMLSELAGFPVKAVVTMKKHSLASSQCEVFVLHVEELEIMPY